jgi:hypothetical protein
MSWNCDHQKVLEAMASNDGNGGRPVTTMIQPAPIDDNRRIVLTFQGRTSVLARDVPSDWAEKRLAVIKKELDLQFGKLVVITDHKIWIE